MASRFNIKSTFTDICKELQISVIELRMMQVDALLREEQAGFRAGIVNRR